jgi:hypothetical protein
MNPEGEYYERYEFVNLLSWLQVHALAVLLLAT